MIRFHIMLGDELHLSNWEDESVQHGPTATAVVRVSELRRQFGPQAAITVERDVVPPRQPQSWTRFSLTYSDGRVMLTNPVPSADADRLGAQLAVDYPKATLSRKEWVA